MITDSKQLTELKRLIPNDNSRLLLLELLQAIPNIVALLNEDRRLVFSNQALLDSVSIPNFEDAFQLRPGELFKCVNSDIEPGGCGASEACQLCGALRAMEDSKSSGEKITNECRILSKSEKKTTAYNFRFTSTPFSTNGAQFFVVTIEDISDQTRKAELERIFFHDILNSLSGIQGVVTLMQNGNSFKDIHMHILEESYKTLSRTIKEQRDLAEAESGDLTLQLESVNSADVINEVILLFRENTIYSSEIIVAPESTESEIITDHTLLQRILTNMAKNALEASGENDTITIGSSIDEEFTTFSINNPGYISRETQLQIFERAFSTKGVGRGLGTYSMKLFGENYLKGDVGFTSDENQGTTFYIKLPVKITEE